MDPLELDEDDVVRLLNLDSFEDTARDCHSVSIRLVNAGVPGRVARGSCQGVGSQHSWIVLGPDVYAPDARIIDATLWSYDDEVEGVWHGTARDGLHVPHGAGSIWEYGQPQSSGGPIIELVTREPLSSDAQLFLDLLGPLDVRGWAMLAHAPVGGWPAEEIIGVMYDTPALSALVPIDVVGNLTDRNPGDLYLATAPTTENST